MTASAPHPYEGQPSEAPYDRQVAAVAVILLLIGMPVGWLGGKTTTGDVIGMIVAIVIVIAIMAAGFVWLLPRRRAATATAARSTLILGAVAIITCAVFWTGLPIGIGAVAVALGLSLRGSGETKATVGLVLGAFAAVASFVLLLVG
jgi:hypothetical protein